MPGKWSASPSQATWQDILGSSVLMVCSRYLECLSGCCSWMLRLTKEAKLQYVRNEMMVIIKNAWFRNLWMLLLSRSLHQKQLAVDLNWNCLTQRMGTCLTSEQTLVIISAAGYAHFFTHGKIWDESVRHFPWGCAEHLAEVSPACVVQGLKKRSHLSAY